MSIKQIIKSFLRIRIGSDGGSHQPNLYPEDVSQSEIEILKKTAGCTMTTLNAQISLIRIVDYLDFNTIGGCFVECGVWRGGSSMIMALALLKNKSTRNLYLYDTFEGMTAPTELDKTADGISAKTHLEKDSKKETVWCLANLVDVKKNMMITGYSPKNIHYIEGPVEKTIPTQSPNEPISLLRLDTDWYESTKHELENLYPKLVKGGVLIIDDYGYWEGARKAADEFFIKNKIHPYLHRVDRSQRIFVKY